MSVLQAVLLGFLQGITEFLPVSSSGHLAVVQHLFNLQEMPILFDVMLHLATLLAVVLFFFRQIAELFTVFVHVVRRINIEEERQQRQILAALVCATAVTGVLGVVFSKIVPDMPLKVVCAGFIVTAAILILSEKIKWQQGEIDTVTWRQGLLCGFAQGLGVLPGISRSGITIAGALAGGVDRKTAGEFSFLLSIPAILGAFVLELKDLGALSASVSAGAVLCGCLAAFVAGFAALALLMRLIRTGKLSWFAVYLVPLGVFGLIFF